jgi:hypothetical protein
MYNLFPECPNDAEGVKRILTLDWISRREKHWPLVRYDDVDMVMYQTINTAKPKKTVAMIDTRKSSSVPERDAVRRLHDTFPAIRTILSKYSNKVAVCGGILTRACTTFKTEGNNEYICLAKSDCDLFFYGCAHNDISADTLEEYRNILEDCVSIIASETKSNVAVDRTENVVNVTVRDIGGSNVHIQAKHIQYQFILRIYESLDNIIGGFDLGSCMMAYDGQHIYATQIGAWCLAKKAIIVDPTRRSTSFEHRILKYYYMGFNIVLPGLNQDIEFAPREGSEDTFHSAIAALKSVGIGFIRFDGEHLHSFYRINSNIYNLNNRLRIEKIKRKNKKADSIHYYLTPINKWLSYDEKQKPHTQQRYSDYGSFKASCIVLYTRQKNTQEALTCAIINALKNNRQDKMFVCALLPNEYSAARKVFADLIDNPQIDIHQDVLDKVFAPAIENTYRGHPDPPGPDDDDRVLNSRRDCRRFAEFFSEYQQILMNFMAHNKTRVGMRPTLGEYGPYAEFTKRVYPILRQRIADNQEIWCKDFKGLRWRTVNPTSQHTSSLNPIIEDPRKFYVNCYRPFHIGISNELERYIWLVLRLHGKLHKDISLYILRLVIRETMMWYNSQTSY